MPTKDGPPEPTPTFSPQEAPTKPSVPHPPIEQTGALDAFEQQALEAWNDDSVELSSEDEQHIDAARARVLAFAKDQALLDWLDEEELAADSQGHGATQRFAAVPAGEEATVVDETLEYGPRRDAAATSASPGEILRGGDAHASRTGTYEPAPLVRVTGGALAELAPAIERAARFAERSRSKATLRAYGRKWRDFCDWCRRHGLSSLPAEPNVVATYLGERVETWGVQSLQQALSAIRHFHMRANAPVPCHSNVVDEVFAGIKRTKGIAPQRQAFPLTPDMLRRMISAMPWELASARDRAVLCLGFSAALRRSELVALDVSDLDFVEDGLAVLVRKSKTDQEAVGEVVGVGYGQNRLTCPVRAVRDWLTLSSVDVELFRGVRGDSLLEPLDETGKDVTRIVKRAAKRAEFEDAIVQKLSAHSLRAGFATTAAEQKKTLYAIARQGRWKKWETVKTYIRNIDSFTEASTGLGM